MDLYKAQENVKRQKEEELLRYNSREIIPIKEIKIGENIFSDKLALEYFLKRLNPLKMKEVISLTKSILEIRGLGPSIQYKILE